MVKAPRKPWTKRSIAAFALLAALAFLAITVGCDRGNHPEQIGRRAPEFAITDGAHSIDLSHYRGQVVVLNFWASWCAPCLEELPTLEHLQRDLPGVQVLAISTDDDPAAYQRFLVAHGVTLLTVRDAAQHSNSLYGTFRYPETYIIDKSGIIRRKFIGPQDWTSPEIVNYLKKLAS